MRPIEKIREDFPILGRKINGKQLVYLDSAATTQKPKQVIDAMNSYYTTNNANVHRGVHKLSEESTLAYEEAHKTVGKFINSHSIEEVVFTKNATESLNLLAYSLTKNLTKGDEIVLSRMEHHSNLIPWQQLARQKGLNLRFLEIEDWELKDFSVITPKTKIVSVAHVSNVLGTINPVKEIAQVAHENQAVMVVDGAASVPHMHVDVQKLECDFLAFSVTGDTPILVSLDNDVKLLPINEVIKKLKKGKRGSVLTLNNSSKVSFESITGHLVHRDNVFQIKYESCAIPLQATGYHSVYVWEAGDIIPKKVNELKRGDNLITFNKISENIIDKYNTTTLNYIHYGNNIKEKVLITPELMRLIGYYLAEGCLVNGKIQLTFNKNEKAYISDCKKLIEMLEGTPFYRKSFEEVHTLKHMSFSEISRRTGLDRETIKKYLGMSKTRPGIYKPPIKQMCANVRVTKSRCDIRFFSKRWSEFFDMTCGRKNEKHLPHFVWKMPKKYVLEMLKGYLRGDASKNEKYRLVVRSVAKNIIIELCWLLKLNGISSTIGRTPSKNGWRESYSLILQRGELKKLKEFKMQTVKDDSPKAKLLPVDALKEVFREVKPRYNWRISSVLRNNKKRATKNGIKNVITWIEKNHTKPLTVQSTRILKKYKELVNGDIGMVRIKEIKRMSAKQKVYDISVDNCERFFGGVYPILLHNSGHKMLGPTGIGVLYGKKEALEKLDPLLFGGGMVKEVDFEKASWDNLPWRMEAGTPNVAGAIGLSAAINYLEKEGMGSICKHEQSLTSYTIEHLQDVGAKIIGPISGERSGIASFTLGKIHPHDLSTILDQEGIAIRGGHHCAMPLMKLLGVEGTSRASFYLYNSREDVDSLVAGIKKAKKVFA